MEKNTIEHVAADGKSRVFDGEGNLLSIDGMRVSKAPTPAEEKSKKVKPFQDEGGQK